SIDRQAFTGARTKHARVDAVVDLLDPAAVDADALLEIAFQILGQRDPALNERRVHLANALVFHVRAVEIADVPAVLAVDPYGNAREPRGKCRSERGE